MSRVEIDAYYQTVSPRNVFFKNLPHGSAVLDIGAGEGEMAFLRTWPEPQRPDLSLSGIALEPKPGLAAYTETSIGDFEKAFPTFSRGNFDAAVCCHFVEHLKDHFRFFHWLADVLRPGATAYIEWPHEMSAKMPPRTVLHEAGFDTYTVNFYDDDTHRSPPLNMSAMKIGARGARLQITGQGRIKFPYLAELMRDHAVHEKDKSLLTMAIWASVGWSQYVLIEKG